MTRTSSPSGGTPQRTFRQRVRSVLAPIPGAVPLVRLAVETVKVAFRYRVTGLSAEAGFFMLLSLPPLLLGLFATVGFFGARFSDDALNEVSSTIVEWASRFLTPEVVTEIIEPTVEQTLRGGRADLLSIGFLLSLWAGSRALHVFIDTISIMYGQSGVRGIVSSRLLSLGLFLGSMLLGGIVLPLVLAGPGLIGSWLPDELQWAMGAYWPVVGIVGLVGVTGLYHFATPQRSPFFRDIPGALLAVLIWVGASFVLRAWITSVVQAQEGSYTVFGPLTAPIIAMIWFYLIALAALIGAALNASIRRLWPPPEYRGPVVRASEWWDQRRNHQDGVSAGGDAGEEARTHLTPLGKPTPQDVEEPRQG